MTHGVITYLEPDILQCEVKWALGSIIMNKASGIKAFDCVGHNKLWNILKEISSLSHSTVFLYFLHCSLGRAFLFFLAILWNSGFRWVYLSFSPLPFTSLFSTICKASSDNHFAFALFFFLGMVLITAPIQWHEPLSTVLQALSTRSNALNLFVTSTV